MKKSFLILLSFLTLIACRQADNKQSLHGALPSTGTIVDWKSNGTPGH